jgi:hypothetical protein
MSSEISAVQYFCAAKRADLKEGKHHRYGDYY